MSVFLTNLADRVFSRLTPSLKQSPEKERGALLYHADGSVSLNLLNKDVQKRITEQIESLAQFKVESSADGQPKENEKDC